MAVTHMAGRNGRNGLVSLCALVPYPRNTAPSQRYRLEQWLPHLEQRGISVDIAPFADQELMDLLYRPGRRLMKGACNASAFFRRLREIGNASKYDAVVIHRAACLGGPAVIERAISILGGRLIFDFDDAIYLLDTTEANRQFGWLKFPGKTATICRISQHVVVGNSYLADYARRFNPSVTVIPTSVDTDRYYPAKRAGAAGCLVVGWMGSSTSQRHLERFVPMLREVTAWPGIELRVVSDREPVLPEVPYVWRRWSAESEISDLTQFDIGIMPMPDDQWSRGKCSLKALLYMAMGIPAVCSSVGANREIIRHGENGLLATTEAEWLANLKALVDDPQLREKLGTAGRRRVEEDYSMVRCAERFAGVVRDTLAARGTTTCAE
jgi:glycosyltransferase involved in cell wall biosynthesis